MKGFITTCLLLFFPFMAVAMEPCPSSEEYTIDKRCYVTDAQKRTKPYNATVKLDGCTGTVIKDKDKLYVYTAKHCVVDGADVVYDRIKIQTQSGKNITVNFYDAGNYDTSLRTNDKHGDWAVYTIPGVYNSKNIASTDFTDNEDSDSLLKYKARVIGYGALKIMKDKDISDYKNKYIQYLKDKKGIIATGNEKMYGFDGEGGVRAYYDDIYSSKYVVNFLNYLERTEPAYYQDLFVDRKLKVSHCYFTGSGDSVGCQIWSGNSGGGVFDDDGKLMGILTGYKAIIGGKNHAKASEADSSIVNVNFLRQF